MFHNILVAVDGSTHSDLALAQAIDLAEAERSRMTLMTGIAPVTVAGLAASTTALPEAIRGAQAQAESVIRRARDRVRDDVPVTTIVTEEPIRSALIERVEAGHHDLIVMGSRGLSDVQGLVLGSVTHKVIQMANIPLLVDRTRGVKEPSAEAAPQLTRKAAPVAG